MTQGRIRIEENMLVISLPVSFSQKSGRRWMIVPPSGDKPVSKAPKQDDALLKALIRAHKWAQALEAGRITCLDQIAREQNINGSYISRIIRLNLLAPDIKTMILDGRQPQTMRLADMLKSFPDEWQAQRRYFGLAA